MNTIDTLSQRTYSLKLISKKTWVIILIAFLLVIAWGLYSDYRLGYQVLSGDQLFYKVFTDVMSKPDIYVLDPVYANAQNTQVYTPFFLQLIKMRKATPYKSQTFTKVLY